VAPRSGDGEGEPGAAPAPSSSHGEAGESEGGNYCVHAGTPRQRRTAGEGHASFVDGKSRIRGPRAEGPALAIGIGEPDRLGNHGKGRLRRHYSRSKATGRMLKAAVLDAQLSAWPAQVIRSCMASAAEAYWRHGYTRRV